MDMKAFLKNVLKVALEKELAGAFLPNREARPAAEEMPVTCPDNRLSSTLIGSHLTNGTWSWWQRTEYCGAEGWGTCIGQNWLPGLGGAPGDWNQIARKNRAVT